MKNQNAISNKKEDGSKIHNGAKLLLKTAQGKGYPQNIGLGIAAPFVI